MDLLRKTVPFELGEVKAAADGGWEVAGYASTWGGEPDSYNDVVAKGAFLESILKRSVKLFYQHLEPIGKALELTEDDRGLFGRFSILDTTTGTDAHKLAKAGVIDQLSIGYRTLDAEYREDGVRVIKKADLFEVSLVPIPANQSAVITSVKSDQSLDRYLIELSDENAKGVEAVKAYLVRRASEGREPGERQLAAISRLIDEAKAWDEVGQLVSAHLQQAKAAAGYRPRLALELRARRLGIPYERTAA